MELLRGHKVTCRKRLNKDPGLGLLTIIEDNTADTKAFTLAVQTLAGAGLRGSVPRLLGRDTGREDGSEGDRRYQRSHPHPPTLHFDTPLRKLFHVPTELQLRGA